VADSERNIWREKGKTSCSVLASSFVCENQRKKLLTPYRYSLSKPLVDVDSQKYINTEWVLTERILFNTFKECDNFFKC